ncbi:GrpB family protein [Pseudomonas sp. SWRI79]|uniref:GrpB family protein n=1 Tax=Pseudomonas farris TaxID=2841207 RepID=A0ABS6PPW1_9PSED|nr:GrpB family protein [Pseudomonas farris]MBV4462490.1 GrpB family protein [Pseudomonas farris]
MALTSKISPYDSRWPALFLSAKEQIAKAFGTDLIAIHHVGSTAVPGLAAKPEIDLLVEVAEHRNESSRDNVMRELGYARGSDLSAGHHFYRRDVDGVRTHKAHVCITGHGQIERMLRFRDLLRDAPVIRQQYQDLKLELEANNTGGISEYLARKAPFIDGLMGSVSTPAHRGAAGCDTDSGPSR